LVDILTFDGFFGPKFHILTPKWLPTTAPHARAPLECLHLNERQLPIHIGMAAFP